MNDMRRKLLPVFLLEAARKIELLDNFLESAPAGEGSLTDLEAAFRAAHTLKGTAALVQIDSVCTLSARMEGVLEGHFEAQRYPSPVEFDALKLVLSRIKQLVEAVSTGAEEPAGIVAEAEMALKLATALPGRRNLVESSLPSQAEADSDPFADDPLIDPLPALDVAAPSVVEIDPFADDPDFLLDAAPVPTPHPPRAADASAVNDPFAEDEDLLGDVDPLPLSQAVISTEGSPPVEVAPATESFAERLRKRLSRESAIGTAQRLAETLSRNQGQLEKSRLTCCHFRVAGRDYYLPINNMVEIADLPAIIRLPLAPRMVRGLINIRGRVLPLIDLALQTGDTSRFVAVRKLVVAESSGERLAFLADGIPDLAEVNLGEKIDVKGFIEQFRAGVS
jgi:chemotaxis signal transduction protein/HPt (histidine-containing phosphotransfer) domain-containing protein